MTEDVLSLKWRNPSRGIQTPQRGKANVFIDDDGVMKMKLPDGSTVPVSGEGGGFMPLPGITGTTEADRVALETFRKNTIPFPFVDESGRGPIFASNAGGQPSPTTHAAVIKPEYSYALMMPLSDGILSGIYNLGVGSGFPNQVRLNVDADNLFDLTGDFRWVYWADISFFDLPYIPGGVGELITAIGSGRGTLAVNHVSADLANLIMDLVLAGIAADRGFSKPDGVDTPSDGSRFVGLYDVDVSETPINTDLVDDLADAGWAVVIVEAV